KLAIRPRRGCPAIVGEALGHKDTMRPIAIDDHSWRFIGYKAIPEISRTGGEIVLVGIVIDAVQDFQRLCNRRIIPGGGAIEKAAILIRVHDSIQDRLKHMTRVVWLNFAHR